MKIFFLIIIIFFLIFSCKKKDETEYKDIFGEIIYTDSFSPKEWENPIARTKIKAIDKDIGNFIKKDVMDPKLRKILNLVEGFINNIKNNNINEIQNILTPSAYNSFTLRFSSSDIFFGEEYIIRIGYPVDIKDEQFWIQFKILFPTKSLISKLEIEFSEDDCKISDFENKFFSDIKNML